MVTKMTTISIKTLLLALVILAAVILKAHAQDAGSPENAEDADAQDAGSPADATDEDNSPDSTGFYARLGALEKSNFDKHTQNLLAADVVQKYLSQACRRHPYWPGELTQYCMHFYDWKLVQYDWWEDVAFEVMEDMVEPMHECMEQKFIEFMKTWPDCDLPENEKHPYCYVPETTVTSTFQHVEDGEVAKIDMALSPQEAFAVRALGQCIRDVFPLENPYYEKRSFGDGASENYLESGNICTFLTGFVQLFVPGVAARLIEMTTAAWLQLNWEERGGLPDPKTLGFRTSEHLLYESTSKLGLHVDGESIYSIIISLSDPDDYEGGEFRLTSGSVKFKPDKLTALVFTSDTGHGVNPIISGKRETFATELWELSNVMLGTPRPSQEVFKEQVRLYEKYEAEEQKMKQGKDEL